LLGNGFVADELLATREIIFRKREVGTGLRQIGPSLIKHDFERPAIDGEQEVAFLHHLAVSEMHALQVPRDAGANFDGIHGYEPSNIFVLIDDGTLDGQCHRHLRRRWRALGRWRPLSAPSKGGCQDHNNAECQ
jgi:hypothetical protein